MMPKLPMRLHALLAVFITTACSQRVSFQEYDFPVERAWKCPMCPAGQVFNQNGIAMRTETSATKNNFHKVYTCLEAQLFADVECNVNVLDPRGACFNIGSSVDSTGAEDSDSSCGRYQRNSAWCGKFDDADFNSSRQCCNCGGGQLEPKRCFSLGIEWTTPTGELQNPNLGIKTLDRGTAENASDLIGGNIYAFKCQEHCLSVANCAHFTYRQTFGGGAGFSRFVCHLHDSSAVSRPSNYGIAAISGGRSCTPLQQTQECPCTSHFQSQCCIAASNSATLQVDPEALTVDKQDTIFIGFYTTTRGGELAGSDADGSYFGLKAHSAITAQLALLAFKSQKVLPYTPAQTAPYNITMVFADTCPIGAIYYNSKDFCSPAYATKKIIDMMYGGAAASSSFPPLRAVVGGIAEIQVHAIPSSLLIPEMGFLSDSEQLSNKDRYQYFMRTNPSEKSIYEAMFSLMVPFFPPEKGELIFDVLLCEDTRASAQMVKDTAADFFDGHGYTIERNSGHKVNIHVFNEGAHFARSPEWVIALSNAQPGLVNSGELSYAQYLINDLQPNFEKIKSSGSKVHASMLTTQCPMFDIMHYASTRGLVGNGHFWIGRQIILGQYAGQYTSYVRVLVAPLYGGAFNSYAEGAPYDGYTYVVPSTTTNRDDKFFEFFNSLKSNASAVFGNMYDYINQDAWDATTFAGSTWWEASVDPYVFDAVWSTLLGINQVLLDIGKDFTNQQLVDRIVQNNFEGLTGRVNYNLKNYNRDQKFEFRQLRVDWTRPICTPPDAATCSAPTDLTGSAFTDYLQCLQVNSMDSPGSFMSRITDGAVQNCNAAYARADSSCDFDFSAVATDLPSGTTYGKLCRGRCDKVISACALPSFPLDLSAPPVTYIACLRKECIDSDPSTLSVLSGGSFMNCATAKQSLACDADLASAGMSVPAGTLLMHMCGGQCNRECLNAPPNPCAIPDAQGMATYFECLSSRCQDGNPAFISLSSGGAVPDCGALSGFVGSLGGDCNFLMTGVNPALPNGTLLHNMCGGTCKDVCKTVLAAVSCPAISDFGAESLASATECTTSKCIDVDPSVVSSMSSGNIPNCALFKGFIQGSGGDCNSDVTGMTASPLPAGTKLFNVCSGSCQTECEASKLAAITCPTPPDFSAIALASAVQCTSSKCIDVDNSVIAGMSGNTIPDCANFLAFVEGSGGDCTKDVTSLSPAPLPTGTKLYEICGGTCKTACESCHVPTIYDSASLVTYFACILGKCEDSDSALMSTLTGGLIGSCAAAYAFQQGNCAADMHAALPTVMPAGTSLNTICSQTCQLNECKIERDVVGELKKDLEDYLKCNGAQRACRDTSPELLKNLTGDDLTCATLKSRPNVTCSTDMSLEMSSRLPTGTTLQDLCQDTCGCIFLYQGGVAEVTIGNYSDNQVVFTKQPLFYNGSAAPAQQELAEDQNASCETVHKLNVIGKNYFDQCKFAPKECEWHQFINTTKSSCDACASGKYTDTSERMTTSTSRRRQQFECEACKQATYLDDQGECKGCDKGKYADVSGLIECKDCAPGKSQPEIQEDRCNYCPIGHYSGLGQAKCKSCAVGTFTDKVGSVNCTNCPQGSKTAGGAADAITMCMCEKNTFNSRPTEENALLGPVCTLCSGGQVTQEVGSNSSGDCACPAGTQNLKSDAAPGCSPCLEGLDCSDPRSITVKKGFYAVERVVSRRLSSNYDPVLFKGVQGRYAVFECKKLPYACPAGMEPQKQGGENVCPSGREGLMCTRCKTGMKETIGAECQDCTLVDNLPLIVCALVLLPILFGIYRVNDNRHGATKSISILLVGIMAGMMVTVVQQMGVFSILSVPWDDPLKTLFSTMQVVVFNLDVLHVGCISDASPVVMYAANLLSIVGAIMLLGIIHIIIVLTRHGGKFAERKSSVMAAIGMVLMAFLISIVNTAITPFLCNDHPVGPSTMGRYPTVVCWETSDHSTMVVLGVIFLALPTAFVAFCTWIVWQYPKKVRSMDIQFLHTYFFLFFRFKAEWYWFVLFFIIRNFAIALTPLIGRPLVEVFIICAFFLSSILLIALCFPWRHELASYIDLVVMTNMVLIMCLAGFFVQDLETQSAGILASIVAVVILLVVIGVFLYACYPHLQPWWKKSLRKFEYFICHHKGGCGAFARLMKVMLKDELEPDRKVWIDCDDLQNLSWLFDYVGSQSEIILVLMSKELLYRPWCMGELTTAHRNQPRVQVMPVRFPDFVVPTDQWITDYASIVDISCLGAFQIDLGHVQDMIRWLRAMKACVLTPTVTKFTMNALCKQLTTVSRATVTHTAENELESPVINILADHLNMESLATGLILCKLVALHVLHDVFLLPNFVPSDEHLPLSTTTAINVLSNGCFSNPMYIRALCAQAESEVRHIPIISEDGFRFPAGGMITELEAVMPSIMTQLGLNYHTQVVIQIIRDIFREIAVVFAPQDYSSNERLLGVKSRDVAGRIQTGKLQQLILTEAPTDDEENKIAEPSKTGDDNMPLDEKDQEEKVFSSALDGLDGMEDGMEVPGEDYTTGAKTTKNGTTAAKPNANFEKIRPGSSLVTGS